MAEFPIFDFTAPGTTFITSIPSGRSSNLHKTLQKVELRELQRTQCNMHSNHVVVYIFVFYSENMHEDFQMWIRACFEILYVENGYILSKSVPEHEKHILKYTSQIQEQIS